MVFKDEIYKTGDPISAKSLPTSTLTSLLEFLHSKTNRFNSFVGKPPRDEAKSYNNAIMNLQ